MSGPPGGRARAPRFNPTTQGGAGDPAGAFGGDAGPSRSLCRAIRARFGDVAVGALTLLQSLAKARQRGAVETAHLHLGDPLALGDLRLREALHEYEIE